MEALEASAQGKVVPEDSVGGGDRINLDFKLKKGASEREMATIAAHDLADSSDEDMVSFLNQGILIELFFYSFNIK